MSKDRKLIERMKWELDIGDVYEKLMPVDVFLEKIQDAIDKVEMAVIRDRGVYCSDPDAELVFQIMTGYAGYDGGTEFYVVALSKEDDEEYARRIATEEKSERAKLARKQKAAIRAKEKAERLAAEERAQYERLKAKYG
tara:strand:- start:82743 stop:83159 length:417 start_codon:yes stop_codon:yes gene_type:complete